MDGAERRRHKRVAVNLPVRLYIQGRADPIEAEIRNLSEGGAFVHCAHEIPKGRNVLLEFKLAEISLVHAKVSERKMPSAPDGVTGVDSSVVRWIQRVSEGGFGVEFVELQPEVAKFIRDLVAYLEKAEQAP